MVRVSSLFSQILHHFPRAEFASLVKKHSAEYKAKGFTCWSQFVAMTFCHLAGADSIVDHCKKKLGNIRDGRLHLKFARGHEYLVGFPATSVCRGCRTLNEIRCPSQEETASPVLSNGQV